MEGIKRDESSIVIEESANLTFFQKFNQTTQRRENEPDINENDFAKPNGSSELQTASLLDHPSRIDSSYEDCKTSGNASCDSIDDFFGNTSTSSSSTCRNSNRSTSSQNAAENRKEANFSHNVDSNEGSDKLEHHNYFAFLDDYIRFDVSRTGVSCFSGYSVSVQYEEDFLVGNAGTLCRNLVCGASSQIQLQYRKEKVFELKYLPRASCARPKDCIYRVNALKQETSEIGTIQFQGDLVSVYNSYEKSLSFRRKQGNNAYVITKTETGERQATVELFRGFRGDIIYYGLSILEDVSPMDKALLIALTLTMDIRHRESEMRCSLLWLPLCCIFVVGFFSILPWIFIYNESS